MARETFSVRRNADGTVTFKYKRYVEHFAVADIGMLETYERLKLCAMTAGLQLGEDTLRHLLLEARGLKGEQ